MCVKTTHVPSNDHRKTSGILGKDRGIKMRNFTKRLWKENREFHETIVGKNQVICKRILEKVGYSRKDCGNKARNFPK